MQLKISFLIFILIFLLGCNINTNKEIVKTKIEKKDKITENEHEDKIAIDEPEDKIAVNSNKKRGHAGCAKVCSLSDVWLHFEAMLGVCWSLFVLRKMFQKR